MPAEEPAIKPNFLVRLFVMGLPLGILIMAALSFVVYFNKRNAAMEPKASKYADLMRRDINAEDLRRYNKILSEDIGERTALQKESLEAAASFVESTMGFDNMGYQVEVEPHDEGGASAPDLIVELKGRSKPKEVIVVMATYYGEKGQKAWGPSGLMSLAHHFTGTSHKRTLRFIVVGRQLEFADDGGGAPTAVWPLHEKTDELIRQVFKMPDKAVNNESRRPQGSQATGKPGVQQFWDAYAAAHDPLPLEPLKALAKHLEALLDE